jgi:N-hydroxyarylamine O-acetyltransferase
MKIDHYLERIGWRGTLNVDSQTLRDLHFQHATRIPFENLDIQLGRQISLEPEALERKMVGNQRGGYCFEQNTFFQHVLREIGFEVIACEARVRMGRQIIAPRTHMLLIVQVDGEKYLADVGFGGDGLLYPVALNGSEQKQFLWDYRIKEEGRFLVLQTRKQDGWSDLYAFVPEHREPIDFELANWYTSTHPQSRFVQTLTVQLPTPEARLIVRNKTYIIDRGEGREETRQLKSREELMKLLDERFGLKFPAETNFKNPVF